ncbi:hypothetical protein U9M48_008323, partial [Paspalum notatum var. saurae]
PEGPPSRENRLRRNRRASTTPRSQHLLPHPVNCLRSPPPDHGSEPLPPAPRRRRGTPPLPAPSRCRDQPTPAPPDPRGAASPSPGAQRRPTRRRGVPLPRGPQPPIAPRHASAPPAPCGTSARPARPGFARCIRRHGGLARATHTTSLACSCEPLFLSPARLPRQHHLSLPEQCTADATCEHDLAFIQHGWHYGVPFPSRDGQAIFPGLNRAHCALAMMMENSAFLVQGRNNVPWNPKTANS